MPVYTEERAKMLGYWLHQKRPGELDFIDAYAKRTGGPIVELASGAARVVREMAKRGHKVIGLELSEPMLAKAREVVAALDPEVQARIELIHGDMTRFNLGQRFPLIYIPFNSFWYNLGQTKGDEPGAGEARADACVRCMLAHLADGGTFLVEGERSPDDYRWYSKEHVEYWERTSKRLGFQYRYEQYVLDPEQSSGFRDSFLVGWRD